MLIEKEIISPGQYFYTDEKTGLPRKLDVTPDLTRYWLEQGNLMLSSGLTIPVPYEHDFNAHPMTPKDKLLNNSGWAREYKIKNDKLFAVIDIQDEETVKKLPTTIRWTSPWINSFTDGNGKQWNNVISHIALTTRPRITKQAPFGSVAAALSMATSISVKGAEPNGEGLDLRGLPQGGFFLSRAGRLGVLKETKELVPRYPIAFSLVSGIFGEFPPPKGKGKKPSPKGGKPGEGGDKPPISEEGGGEFEGEEGTPPEGSEDGGSIDLEPYGDPKGDVKMEELLCDLLSAIGVHCEKGADEASFKRNLYTAAMTKIHELTGRNLNPDEAKPGQIKNQPIQPKPQGQAGASNQPNPMIQQEQQPMYMSLEDINKLPDPLKGVALSMYAENQKLRTELDSNSKKTASLEASKIKEANEQRNARVNLLGRISPKIKSDLDAMLVLPSMALSMGDGGAVVDPLSQTLTVLEKGLSDIPRLLTTPSEALFSVPQPTDTDIMNQEEEAKLVDSFSRMMGCPPLPEKKAS